LHRLLAPKAFRLEIPAAVRRRVGIRVKRLQRSRPRRESLFASDFRFGRIASGRLPEIRRVRPACRRGNEAKRMQGSPQSRIAFRRAAILRVVGTSFLSTRVVVLYWPGGEVSSSSRVGRMIRTMRIVRFADVRSALGRPAVLCTPDVAAPWMLVFVRRAFARLTRAAVRPSAKAARLFGSRPSIAASRDYLAHSSQDLRVW
jgi:hypothetical protein